MSLRSQSEVRYWRAATWSVAALLVMQSLIFGASVAIINLDGSDYPLRAFLITTGVSAVAAILLFRRGLGTARAVAWAAVATTGTWLVTSVFEMCLYSNVGIVW
ncbi:MAG: hypothetical protein JWN03_8586 [Nocardia sp.]|nr:hypothetical protein [Nocardia sp.]